MDVYFKEGKKYRTEPRDKNCARSTKPNSGFLIVRARSLKTWYLRPPDNCSLVGFGGNDAQTAFFVKLLRMVLPR